MKNMFYFEDDPKVFRIKGLQVVKYKDGTLITRNFDKDGRLIKEVFPNDQTYRYYHLHTGIACIRPKGLTHLVKGE